MAELDYTTDIAPIQNRFFDDPNLTIKPSGREREMLLRQYRGLTAQRLEDAQMLSRAKRDQVLLEREQQLLIEDSQKRRRQAEIDQKLGVAAQALNAAMQGKTLEDKATGVISVQSQFPELSGTNPAFQALLDAANRKISFLGGQEKALLDAQGRTTTTTPKADPSKVRMWQADFDFVSGIQKKTPDASFGTTSSKPAYAPEELDRARRIAPLYGVTPEDFEDDESFVISLEKKIRSMAPTGAADTTESGAEANPYAPSWDQ